MKKWDHRSKGWEFESGTLIKNDKNGIFVSFELNSERGDSSGNSRYQAYFFEKKNETWEIKFGIISDLGGSNVSPITSPDDFLIKVSYDTEKNVAKYEGTSEYYSKKWEGNSGGTSELLFDGVFKNLKDKPSASYVYVNDKQLHKQVNLDQTSVEKWFKLFENKKGRWNTIS